MCESNLKLKQLLQLGDNHPREVDVSGAHGIVMESDAISDANNEQRPMASTFCPRSVFGVVHWKEDMRSGLAILKLLLDGLFIRRMLEELDDGRAEQHD